MNNESRVIQDSKKPQRRTNVKKSNSLKKTVLMTVVASFIGAAMVLSSMPFSTSPGTASAAHSSSSSSAAVYKVLAWNDLGMHCACPTFEGFLLLPPFNTVRAQVLKYGTNDPIVMSATSIATDKITVNYAMVENTDANLQADPYFASWITNAPKLGFPPVVVGGKVIGLAGYGLYGTMGYNSNLLAFEAVGIPAYPVITGNAQKDVMTDPLGGAKRDPYLTANVTVKNSAGAVLASTSTVVPVAFGGCCSCHLQLAAAMGYPATPAGSFTALGVLHSRNTSGINIAMIDPDGNGVGGPVRCSWCHWDPAMGESAAPGWPAGTQLLPGATFTLKKSTMSFSDVLHRFHNNSALVKSTYDPNIATDCYKCHPGNGIQCYRGVHKGKAATMFCMDCHGNLTQRASTGQLAKPWLLATLPTCSSPSPGITSAFACHSPRGKVYPTSPAFAGAFINGRGHKGSIDCQACHGSPHAERPSTLAADNVGGAAANSSVPGATYPAGVDSTYPLGVCQFCHPSKGTVWQRPFHL
jgi:hypothetical protein